MDPDASTKSLSASAEGGLTRRAPDRDRSAPAPSGALGEIGTCVNGRYEIREQLGEGGMGIVYLARDIRLARDVALKMHRQVGNPNATARLLREGLALARLSHPNVVTLYEVDTLDAEHLFIAMEFVDGRTLREWLAEARRPWRKVVSVFIDAGRGLAAAHEAGLVHRDFKPDNVLIGNDDRVRVADFGIARNPSLSRMAPETNADPQAAAATPAAAQITRAGTPAYMSPEQILGTHVDHRTDQFAFCVALFDALRGELPFTQASTLDRVAEIARGVDVGPLPGDLSRLVSRGLAYERENRYPSMNDLLADLEASRTRRWARPRVLLVALAATVAVVVLALLGWNATREDERLAPGSAKVQLANAPRSTKPPPSVPDDRPAKASGSPIVSQPMNRAAAPMSASGTPVKKPGVRRPTAPMVIKRRSSAGNTLSARGRSFKICSYSANCSGLRPVVYARQPAIARCFQRGGRLRLDRSRLETGGFGMYRYGIRHYRVGFADNGAVRAVTGSPRRRALVDGCVTRALRSMRVPITSKLDRKGPCRVGFQVCAKLRRSELDRFLK